MYNNKLITVKGRTDGSVIRSHNGGIFDISPLSFVIAHGYFLLLTTNNGKNWKLLNTMWID